MQKKQSLTLNENSLKRLHRVDEGYTESKKVNGWMGESNSEQNEQYVLGYGLGTLHSDLSYYVKKKKNKKRQYNYLKS